LPERSSNGNKLLYSVLTAALALLIGLIQFNVNQVLGRLDNVTNRLDRIEQIVAVHGAKIDELLETKEK